MADVDPPAFLDIVRYDRTERSKRFALCVSMVAEGRAFEIWDNFVEIDHVEMEDLHVGRPSGCFEPNDELLLLVPLKKR
ncbi:hypothetical protein [Rhizobium sp. NFR07]|uniref:hypothetical protein n=1 Tax=Rhizobium sp. NFR07 TaxID=1566262 RepID=UPI0011605BFD|nr:hypothetical protein [Rhizobium sp. NFR07]